ncbi:CRISPR type III-A-associated RAMP protein Csm4 [Dyadobacter jejuensis]|uniref:CRISPR system Cms protein Csm4 n=1 Tax=Dyadobacter jejuensis TaxID=1082580 RepID=A0A316AJ43_9BACT|nr:type III-A CRISPR-associated RAMP protein Csm4 [Dyadobacter jejuensis]PWJ57825.1 CRISPR type III-A-associated RAMP protein Csm4 [Dyadobacter jejuensis]
MKHTFDVIYFEFTAPLHVSNARSDYGISERTLHSDTMYAAIMQSWAILGKEEWILKNPAYTLSSLFPYTLNTSSKQKVHFFAKPFFPANTDNKKDQSDDAKIYKKIKFVDAWHFQHYLNQTPLTSTVDSVHGSYQTNEPINKNFLTTDVQNRIKRPRNDSEDTVPFYTERLFFTRGSGLFCLVHYENEEAQKQVKAALRLLAENGIGTDRAVGNGQFNVSFGSLNLELPDFSDFAINMSLFCPETKEDLKEMISDEAVRYEIIKRGGWMSDPHNTYRKRSVYMFLEGSVFKIPISKFISKGNTVDLKPDNAILPHKVTNPVWRVGKALFLPVKR